MDLLCADCCPDIDTSLSSFAGIVQNFAWNGMGMIFICYPSLLDGEGLGGTTSGGVWPLYCLWNLLLTVVAFFSAVHVLRHGVPRWLPSLSADGIDSRARDTAAASAADLNGTARITALAAFVLCIIMACEAATVLLATRGDARALGALLLLPFALAIKQAHWPEVWLYRTGTLQKGALDFSFLHSHCIWHILVMGVQGFYFALYIGELRRYAGI